MTFHKTFKLLKSFLKLLKHGKDKILKLIHDNDDVINIKIIGVENNVLYNLQFE